MDLTDMVEWPAPTWSASRLEESRQTAARAPTGGFSGTLARARIMAASGDFSGARQELTSLRQILNCQTLGRGDLRQIIPIALLAHDQRSALYFLSLVVAITGSLRFGIAPASADGAILMRVDRREVTFLMSETLFANEYGESRLQRLVDIYPILARYFESSVCSDGTLVINLGDAGETPGLTFCGNRPGYFLIPDSMFMDTSGYEFMRRHFAQNRLPWEARSPTAFWRGTTTGRPSDAKLGWRSLPRVKLCEIGASNSDLIDSGLTKVIQIDDPGAEIWIQEAGLMRPHVPPESFQNYKYQIDIDGNTTSWPGLFMKLLTGSVVLKVPPREGFKQWYYDRLRPWVNFIPLEEDMSDLVDKVRWLRANDVAARTIGEAGYRLAEDLTYEREIGRSVGTVAAAMKDASGEPIIDLDLSLGGAGAGYLREGWMPLDLSGVDSAGYQSRIDLPRPCGIGGFILRLEVSPAARSSQRLSIAVNGEVIAQRRIIERTKIYIPLTPTTLGYNSLAVLTLLHPDAVQAASADFPGDSRLLGIRLHRLAVLGSGSINPDPCPDFSDAVTALRIAQDPHYPHDLVGPARLIPPRAELLPLYTYHGTLVYADLSIGRLRHGMAETVPHNVFMADLDGAVTLLRMTETKQRQTIRVRPEGQLADQAEGSALDATGHADRFILIEVDGDATFGIGAAGMILCADPSGDLTLSRVKIGPWERFHFNRP